MLNEIDLSRADLNLLVLFEAVFRERHVGRAADQLNLSASAVSHGLGRLRKLLNDPLFLRTPKGVVPTQRAIDLDTPIADILERMRDVLETAEPFDPRSSRRSFTIGAPDGVLAVLLPLLLANLEQAAPAIDIRLRQLLPASGETSPDRAWSDAFTAIEARGLDIAILPFSIVPARFHAQALFDEHFVIVHRKTRPNSREMDLDRFCDAGHVLVSATGEARGFVDDELAKLGRSRRIALTVPNFHLALNIVAETDLVAAVPRTFAASLAPRFSLTICDSPVELPQFQLNAVTSRAAMADQGVAWLMEQLVATVSP